ncbi:MAG: DUF2848 domain-containing protein [Xanthobacteraceae bacterium]
MPNDRAIDLRAVRQLVIGGWTGRNTAAVEAHIKELEALGVRRPKSVPVFYRVAVSLLTVDDCIEVVGEHSSGEVELVLYALEDGIWIGVGSDHTDRKAETIGVTLSKQMCAKPVGPRLWRYDEVSAHFDRLLLRSFIWNGKARTLYQEGPVTTMRAPEELIRLYSGGGSLKTGTAMFCGTLAVHGGIIPADRFDMELEDPVLGRKLTHSYRILPLPEEG